MSLNRLLQTASTLKVHRKSAFTEQIGLEHAHNAECIWKGKAAKHTVQAAMDNGQRSSTGMLFFSKNSDGDSRRIEGTGWAPLETRVWTLAPT